MAVDYRLYLVTDRAILGKTSLKKAVEEAIEGGVTVVQLREKELSTRKFYETALEVRQVTDYYRVPLFINDRVDIALAVDADGVHLGQQDMDLEVARRILGHNKLIGISVENLEQALLAEKQQADYIGVGAVFYTDSKNDINKPIELEGLSRICREIKIPKVAIGGICALNIQGVMLAGASGAAVISAILGQKDIRGAASKLKDIINKTFLQ
ncbi:MAG: thiamine phosphate synthase [Desulfocucumaceae bacterium]